MSECQICASPFTKVLRKKTECPFCQYEACSSCVQQYILTVNDTPNCMNCHKTWSRHVLVKNCSNSFIENEYKRHRENVLFDLERALMPSTQQHVEHILMIRKNKVQQMKNRIEIDYLFSTIPRSLRTIEDKKLEIEIRRKIHHIQTENEILDFINYGQKESTETQKREFVHSCATKDCKGFLSSRWKCGICEKYTCSECHESKGSDETIEHVCNPDSLASVQMLKKDSNVKPCPKCHMTISKVDGCDQMFCVMCKIAFSWRTGHIVSGVIHNPHYLEYLRRNGGDTRNIGDIQCGGLPRLRTHCYRYPDITAIHRSTAEYQAYKLPMFMNINLNNPNMHMDLRTRYMLNELSEPMFKLKLQQKDKEKHKFVEIGQAMSTYIQVVCDIFNKFMENNKYEECISEFKNIMEYMNGVLRDISKTYKCSVPLIEVGCISSINYTKS